MGPYLSNPIKEKHSGQGEGKFMKFATCGMQGWR